MLNNHLNSCSQKEGITNFTYKLLLLLLLASFLSLSSLSFLYLYLLSFLSLFLFHIYLPLFIFHPQSFFHLYLFPLYISTLLSFFILNTLFFSFISLPLSSHMYPLQVFPLFSLKQNAKRLTKACLKQSN